MDRRAGQLHEEYVRKARNVDREFVGTPPGEVGPVEAKLLSFERVRGVVFGAFGEASEPLHQLIDELATSRVTVTGPQRGRKGVERSLEGERTLVVGQIRRRLSIAAVRAQCSSLLGRLKVIGSGMTEAAGRRAKALNMAFSMQEDRAAFMKTIRTDYSRIRKGFGLVA